MSETEYGDEPGGSGVISAEDVKDLSDEQKNPFLILFEKN